MRHTTTAIMGPIRAELPERVIVTGATDVKSAGMICY
jgi:hypothetical protein